MSDSIKNSNNNKKKLVLQRAKTVAAVLMSGMMAFVACGCSEEKTVTDNKKERVVVDVQRCEEEENSDGVSNLSGGRKIDIPDEYDSKQQNDIDFYETGYGKWADKWANMETSQKGAASKWIEEGRQFKHHLPYFPNEDRYGIVLRAFHDDSFKSAKDGKWGLAWGGDFVDVVYKDGKVLKGIIIDEKGDDASKSGNPMSHWGHIDEGGSILKVCEWITEVQGQNFHKDISDLKANSEMNYIFGVVDYVINYGENPQAGSGSTSAKPTSSNAATTTLNNSGTSELIGEDIPEQVWNYFKAAGFSDESTAGIMGNLQAESGMRPDALQSGHGPAAGICQMETYQNYSTRWGTMAKKAEANGKDWTDLLSQLQFMLEDAPEQFRLYTGHGTYTYGNGTVTWWPEAMTVEEFAALDDIDKATEIYMRVFERPSIPHLDRRIQYANEFYERFKGTAKTKSDDAREKCEDHKKGQSYGKSGFDEGEKYHQGQGSHYEGGKYVGNFDSSIGGRNCGATAFVVSVNILLGEVHKFCNVEEFTAISNIANKGTAAFGIDDWEKYGNQWLKDKGLDSTIEMNTELNIKTTDDMKKALSEGYCIVISNGGGGQGLFYDSQGGSKTHTNGHYIQFYKFEDGIFYANDSTQYQDLYAGCKYTEEQMQAWLDARPGGSNFGLKRK